ncbi:MAG TPA: hypothetical protein DCL01_14280 [Thauera sp.]|nr:hypothetical protein [Thauera sp.]HHW62509.1 AAA family ATPase [Rhodocyclaceae bacterium]
MQEQTCGEGGLVRELMQSGVLPGSAGGVSLIETHISWVLLAGEYAWKLKKPLDLGFLDFSTLERRREACEAELRLNRRTAPELYEAVVPVWRTAQGVCVGDRPVDASDPGATPLDYLVRMRRFDQSALFETRLATGQLEPALFDRLARHVVALHEGAAVAQPGEGFGDAAAVMAPVRQNFAQIRERVSDPALLSELARIEAWAEARFAALVLVFDARLAAGRVRECHGDLHLGNLIVLDGEPRLFDAIEFSAALRWTDVVADIAFLVMDLQARGRMDLASRFLNAWLERSGDYAGLQLLPWYVSYRAMVRAKVAAIRAGQVEGAARAEALAECARYLALAAAQMRPPVLALLIASGVSGSGKTSQSQPLVEGCGVVRVRADVERKRLFGLDADARSGSTLGGGLYSAGASARTYARLAELARAVVEAGYPVLVDATFVKRAQRAAFAELAATLGVPFAILAFDAPEATLRDRVRQRAEAGTDASEADVAVLETQLRAREPFEEQELACVVPIDTSSAPDWRSLLPVLARLWPGAVAGE